MSVLKHIQAILLLPMMAIVVIPGFIIFTTETMNPSWSSSSPSNLLALLVGPVLIGLGLFVMAQTIALFAVKGQGTLAPWAPPGKLVIRGIYRRVRNPMISGVCSVLGGEALLLGSATLLVWFIAFVIVNLIYIPLVEEPGLEQRFGQAYVLYKKNVPRWLPRLEPWNIPDDDEISH